MSRFKDKITASTSGLANAALMGARAALAAPPTEEERNRAHNTVQVTPKATGKHRPYRRLVHYDRTGPFHRQVGEARIAGKLVPIMQTYFVHTFRHATKGARIYSGGPGIRLPYVPPAYSAAARFYGYHGPARPAKVAA